MTRPAVAAKGTAAAMGRLDGGRLIQPFKVLDDWKNLIDWDREIAEAEGGGGGGDNDGGRSAAAACFVTV